MPQSTTISFVVFPDGKVDERSLTVAGEEMARQRFISGWLPSHTFGNEIYGSTYAALWRGCRQAGCRSYTLEIDADGEPRVVKD